MKRSLSFVLALLLAATLLTGCGPAQQPTPDESSLTGSVEATDSAAPTQTVPNGTEPETTEAEPELPIPGALEISTDPEALAGRDDVAYLLIYNPAYTDDAHSFDGQSWNLSTRGTGDLSAQVVVEPDRADDVPPVLDERWLAQSELEPVDLSKLHPVRDREDWQPAVYAVGDVRPFYTENASFTDRSQDLYSCRYAGEHCCVWVSEKSEFPDELAAAYGSRFDGEIYDAVTGAFGPARFTENGGKVHILFYDFVRRYYAYFNSRDSFSVLDGADAAFAAENRMNTDHAIVFLNAAVARIPSRQDAVTAALVHEFQHQICSSSRIAALGCGVDGSVDTWFNEAMSGWAEESVLPGIQEKNARYLALHASASLRLGQSLYSFDTRESVAPYASGYLFAAYLSELAGEKVFREFHACWRDPSGQTLSTAEAICGAVGGKLQSRIDRKYPYRLQDGASSAEEILSKLVLDFYLTELRGGDSGIKAFEPIDAQRLLFNNYEPAALALESGGRTVFAVNGGFTVPEDAESGLIYIGLDRDFNPVGPMIVR